MALSSIKIPEKVYVGFQGRRWQDEVPLGYMTPYTTDAAGQKRRDSVDRWAKGYGHNKVFNSVILENKPMVGFRIGRAIRRSGGWNGSGASYIRIEDPRGFELEITIENLAMCMNNNIIENGEIMQKCVWGRDGNRNILLPINSEPFKDSVTTKVALENKISIRDIKVGDKIKLLSGKEGIYLGSMYPINTKRYGSIRGINFGPKRYVMKYVNRNGEVTFVGSASLKVGEILEASEKKLTPAEIESDIKNELLRSTTKLKDASSYDDVLAFTTVAEYASAKITRETVTEATIKGNLERFTHLVVVAENNDGKLLHCRYHDNWIHDRHASGRQYSYYKRNNSSSYYNSGHYVCVKTNGIVGEPCVLRETELGHKSDSDGQTTHIEDADLKELFILKMEITTKTGQVYHCYL